MWLNTSFSLFKFMLGFVVIRPEKSVKHFTVKFLRNHICQKRLNLKKNKTVQFCVMIVHLSTLH